MFPWLILNPSNLYPSVKASASLNTRHTTSICHTILDMGFAKDPGAFRKSPKALAEIVIFPCSSHFDFAL